VTFTKQYKVTKFKGRWISNSNWLDKKWYVTQN